MSIPRWPFQKRVDGRIAITLDNNVWDFLFVRGLDLSAELPSEEFVIFITREVEIETAAIPNATKRALSDFIARTIERSQIATTWVFGFAEANSSKPIRVGGFGQGVWQSKTETEYYAALRAVRPFKVKEKGSQLMDNEADAAIGAKSFSSIAITCELPDRKGPLRFAEENGGAVLRLGAFDKSGLSLREYVKDFYSRL